MNHADVLMLLIPIIIMVFAAYTYNGAATDNVKTQGNLTAIEACEMIRAEHAYGKFIILDVRTSREFAEGYIPGAVNIDVNAKTFAEDVGELSRDAEYLVYCRSGIRSLTAIGIMQKLGFTKTYNMLGGYREWVNIDCAVHG